MSQALEQAGLSAASRDETGLAVGTSLGGMILGNETSGGECKVTAHVPLKEMFGYSNDLRSGTQGKANFTMEFAKYAPVPASVQAELVKEAEAKKKADGK